MAKELPIQFVQFRDERDDFLTEGGGNSKLPTWVDDNTIATNVARIQSHLRDLNERFATRIYDLPILTTVELHEKATAKSHRDSICSMLDVDSKHNVLSSVSPGKLLVKIDSSVDLNKIASRFAVNRNLSKSRQKGLAAIQDIKPYKATLDENIALEDVVKIQLVNYQNSQDNERSRCIFDAFCRAQGIQIEALDYISDLILFKTDQLSQEQIHSLATMDCVLSVMKMPTIEFLAAPDPDESEVCVMIPRVIGVEVGKQAFYVTFAGRSYCTFFKGQIEHTRHRSADNFATNLLAGLIVYNLLPKKSSMNIDIIDKSRLIE